MPIATATAPAADAPNIHANTSIEFPTKGQAEAFIDGINFVGDDRVTVLGKTVMPTGRTTIHLLDERQ